MLNKILIKSLNCCAPAHLSHSIYQQLNDNEEKEYPFHYEILEKKEELFQEYMKKREARRGLNGRLLDVPTFATGRTSFAGTQLS